MNLQERIFEQCAYTLDCLADEPDTDDPKARARLLKACANGMRDAQALAAKLAAAPVAMMDTRDVLGICAPEEEDFPALYALQGKRVRLVLDDETPNAELSGARREEK